MPAHGPITTIFCRLDDWSRLRLRLLKMHIFNTKQTITHKTAKKTQPNLTGMYVTHDCEWIFFSVKPQTCQLSVSQSETQAIVPSKIIKKNQSEKIVPSKIRLQSEKIAPNITSFMCIILDWVDWAKIAPLLFSNLTQFNQGVRFHQWQLTTITTIAPFEVVRSVKPLPAFLFLLAEPHFPCLLEAVIHSPWYSAPQRPLLLWMSEKGLKMSQGKSCKSNCKSGKKYFVFSRLNL